MSEKEKGLFRKSTLDRVSSPDQLNEYIKVTNPGLIVMLLGIFTIIAAGLVWLFSGEIPQTVSISGVVATDKTGVQKIYSYVPIGTSKRLSKDMPVQIALDYADREEYGYKNGHILSVGDEIVTSAYIENKFSDPQEVAVAVASAMQGGNVVEVEMSIEDWSSEKGKDVEITDGAGCAVSAIVGETKPYQLIFEK